MAGSCEMLPPRSLPVLAAKLAVATAMADGKQAALMTDLSVTVTCLAICRERCRFLLVNYRPSCR